MKTMIALIATALALPDGDGIALARVVREASGQAYVPIIVVSGEAQARLEDRSLGEAITDYFDKSLGHQALATFVRGYVRPQPIPGALSPEEIAASMSLPVFFAEAEPDELQRVADLLMEQGLIEEYSVEDNFFQP